FFDDWRKIESLGLHGTEKKGIDRSSLLSRDPGDRRPRYRAKGPMLAILQRDQHGRARVGWFGPRGFRPLVDPGLDDGNLLRRELCVARRHLARFESIHQIAVIGRAWLDGRPRFTPLFHQVDEAQVKAAFAF